MAVATAVAVAACGTPQGRDDVRPDQQGGDDDDIRGVEEVASEGALTALVGAPTFNATTGLLTVPLNASDKLLVVSRRVGDNAVLVNGRIVTDAAGVVAVATGLTGLVKTVNVTVAVAATTVVLDYFNGWFAPGVTGTLTASAPMVQGVTVDFAAYANCALKIRTTGSADTVFFGKDKTASANKIVSFNNGNFPDVWVKGTAVPTIGVSLGVGNDTFTGTPATAALGGLLTPFVDPIVVHGGAGDDALTGGYGADSIYGDEGDNTVDESAYGAAVSVTASAARTLTFNVAKTITAAGASAGDFTADGFTVGRTITVTGTTANGTTAVPKTYTLAAVAATVLTVSEAVTTETTYTTLATIVQPSTTHAKDSVYGLAASGTTTVTYAARAIARAGSGIVAKIGHDTAVPPAWLGGTEDNLDETVGLVVGTDFPDTMWCSNTTDAPCTLVGGKANDSLKAGKSAINTHKLYGGDGADTLILTDNTDKGLVLGGNWTDFSASAVSTTASAGRTLTFNSAKTITAGGASAGDFVADGYAVGRTVTVTGTTANGTVAAPKTFTLTAVAATVLTVAEAVTTEATYSTLATVLQPLVAAPKNLSIDTVDASTVTGDVTLNLRFPIPGAPKAYTPGVPYSGASTKLHINVTSDVSRALCPLVASTQVCTVLANNNGNWIAAGKGADQLTGGTGDDTFDLSAYDASLLGENLKQVTGGGGSDSVDFSGRTTDIAIDLSCGSAGCKTSGEQRLDPGITVNASATRTLEFDAAGKTITAAGTAAGSFLTNGFADGQKITLSSSGGSNDGTFTITDVTATVITVAEALTDEGPNDGTVGNLASITRAAGIAAVEITAAAGRTLTFDDSGDAVDGPFTITASTGDFTDEDFAAGQTIVVSGTTGNDGTYTIDTGGVAATVLTVVEALDAETAYTADATITRATIGQMNEGVSLLNVTNATCPVSAGVLECTVTGSTASNVIDFSGCGGTVQCGGGADIILNADASVNTGCGI